MFSLCKLVIVISLISYGASYGSQDNTFNDERVNSNHTISNEDYEQNFSSDLINLLTSVLLYYDEFRLPLRIAEISTIFLLNFYLLKTGNIFPRECIFILAIALLSSFVSNTSYDLKTITNNSDKNSPVIYFKLVAQEIEHVSSLLIYDYLSVKLFAGLCPICIETVRYPGCYAACKRHWYCEVCIRSWQTQSLLCPLCRQ
ncbi:hypothetical protein [Endozoicomonas sp. ONNA1]